VNPLVTEKQADGEIEKEEESERNMESRRRGG
jgi:hypothetical protein